MLDEKKVAAAAAALRMRLNPHAIIEAFGIRATARAGQQLFGRPLLFSECANLPEKLPTPPNKKCATCKICYPTLANRIEYWLYEWWELTGYLRSTR